MNFSEQPPSKEWAVLKYRGEKIAEVWFKPEGEPFSLTFRIPQKSFQIADLEQRLTMENLLKAVAISSEEVESWHREGESDSDTDKANLDLGHPLPQPPPDVTHLTVYVRLKTPTEVVAPKETGESEIPPERWQDVVARWNAILVMEATMDTLRISVEGLRSEMEASSRKALTADEKVHASNADVAQWNQLKSRLLFALPKVRDFIHRAIWAMGTPERKKLDEFFKDPDPSRVTLAQLDRLQKEIDHLLKDRQALSGHGVTVFQECKKTSMDVQGALRTLQNNAMANARRKMGEARKKGKFI